MSAPLARSRFLTIRKPPAVSDHGLPLGAGLLGATVWGDGAPLRISLDRGDLWDLRPVPEFDGPEYTWSKVVEAHRAGRHEHLADLLEKPYRRPAPTKLPAGRLELRLPSTPLLFKLDRALALAEVELDGGGRLQAFVEAHGVHGRMRLSGADADLVLAAPPFGGRPENWSPPEGIAINPVEVWDLGYASPLEQTWDAGAAFAQAGWGGFTFSVAIAWRDGGGAREFAWVIETGGEGEALEALAQRSRAAAEAALTVRFDEALAEHARWWEDYWSRAVVELPDLEVEEAYYSGMYLFGAAARKGSPPAPLQGPWTTDNGRIPPWKGDYHHDLNTEMTYWPAYAGNQLEASEGFVEWLWQTREACRDWTRRFFGVPGLNAPMQADLHNRQLGGWRQYSHSLASSAWLVHHFHLHWRMTEDAEFLRARAYPYAADVCLYIEAISAERDARGLRRIALSSSPEVYSNEPRAWFDEWTNYDLGLFRWCLGAAAEMADAVGETDAARRWREVLAELPELAIGDDDTLLVAPNHPLPETHRHFSHAMTLHPLGMLRPLENEADARIANATLDQLKALGPGKWMGYSYAWHAALLARAGRGDEAAEALRIFQQAFTFPNGFHTNGDWLGQGRCDIVFGVFTLEGNSAAATAVHEMLLQSRPGALRVFPAVPKSWRQARFERLLADGGVEVSASLEDGEVEVRLLSRRDRTVEVAVGAEPTGSRVVLSAGEPVTFRTPWAQEPERA